MHNGLELLLKREQQKKDFMKVFDLTSEDTGIS